MDDLILLALNAAKVAGEAILGFYGQTCFIENKQDGSPLTAADKASHQIIVENLVVSGLPIVSEEGGNLFLSSNRYWLVDPLDGTKDFIARNGEFTVNIALVDQKKPMLGVVYAPAKDDLYWGATCKGAWNKRGSSTITLVTQSRSSPYRMAVSRFHDHPDVENFARDNQIESRVLVGSALKFCLLAAGEVDVYPRLVGSSEWDTAAGQAVLEAVGGQVVNWNTGESLTYGKTYRRNPRLLSVRSPYEFSDFKRKTYDQELT